MQPTLFSHVLELHSKIKFSCIVDGKAMKAIITHTEDDGLRIAYHVCFSDGHKAVYVPGEPVRHNEFDRTRNLDAYEEAIFDDLAVIPGLKNGGLYSNVSVREIGGDCFNVWIRKRKEFYSVYYKGQYQFTLRKRARWEVSTMRSTGHVINGEMAALLAKHLDTSAE